MLDLGDELDKALGVEQGDGVTLIGTLVMGDPSEVGFAGVS
jgi:hypothetical protein